MGLSVNLQIQENSSKRTYKMVASLLVAIACGFCYGYDLSSLNTTHKEVKCWIHSLNNNLDYQQTCQVLNGNYSSIDLSNSEIISKYSLISSIAFAGGIVTAFLGGLLMDGLGRLRGQVVALILSSNSRPRIF